MFNECKINMKTTDSYELEIFYNVRQILESFIANFQVKLLLQYSENIANLKIKWSE